MFKSRKVKTSVDIFGYQEGFKGIFKDGAESEILKVYDFLEQPNLTKAIGENLFVNAGENLEYTLKDLTMSIGIHNGTIRGRARETRGWSVLTGDWALKELVSTFELGN